MSRNRIFQIVAAAFFVAIVGFGPMTAFGQQKTRVYLPAGWTKLDLDPAQKAKAYSILQESRSNISRLEAQLAEARAQERQKLVEILTPAQRKNLVNVLGLGDGK